ncbi:MAG: hypothetical protein ABIC95_00445 [archaeon]
MENHLNVDSLLENKMERSVQYDNNLMTHFFRVHKALLTRLFDRYLDGLTAEQPIEEYQQRYIVFYKYIDNHIKKIKKEHIDPDIFKTNDSATEKDYRAYASFLEIAAHLRKARTLLIEIDIIVKRRQPTNVNKELEQLMEKVKTLRTHVEIVLKIDEQLLAPYYSLHYDHLKTIKELKKELEFFHTLVEKEQDIYAELYKISR